MKPLQKVVTAQDIESSLYYVHVDGAEDDKLRESLIREQDHRVSNGEAHGDAPYGCINGVPRKPLPASPQLALGNRPEPPPKVYPYYQLPAKGAKGGTQYGRQSADYGTSSRSADSEPLSMSAAQNLLGPRSMHQRLRSADSAALEPVPERQNANLRRWSEQPTMTGPSLPPRPCIRRKDVSFDRSLEESGQGHPPLPPRPNTVRKEFHRSPIPRDSEATLKQSNIIENNGQRLKEEGTSLTLIRRYDGFQWNVGKISNNVNALIRGLSDVPGPHDRNNEYLNAAMSIEISTPGYSKFGKNKSQGDQCKAMDLPRPSPNHEMLASQEVAGAQAVFRRQLQASSDEIRPELRHARDSTTSSLETRDPRPSFNFQRLSHQSENNTKSISRASPTSQGSKTPKTKHYTFRSPWNGLCDFDVGVLGRSIKCKHTITPTIPDSRAGSRSTQVSELRFNLPSSKAFGPPPKTPSPNGIASESKKSSFFSSQHRRHNSSFERYDSQDYDDHLDGDERMDLSLGQELAGGGFAGKQAKLGKLIIENEGLKMLDLVVAANIGLWWKVYEKVV